MMKIFLPIMFSVIAAFGNAMFALGQKKSARVENGLLFVSLSALTAAFCIMGVSPLIGVFNLVNTVKGHWKAIGLSGAGLFFTYLGFNLLYSRCGVSQYALYAVLSILSTTLLVGVWWLKEPVNLYHKLAIILALAAVVLFSIGQSKV
ncbi:transporter [candidate division KSB3 bacterium]|uniref:Transporter n=1 Tax=candidate division KSB3 bacterium TaxID=2044937 RepID=A0A2G6E1X3_9BACT|nr:MAG: transporter [candidate division KSB3 bacterium]PIE28787.1 MAG: transporter [candidate division KSB3 bacterium]